MLFGLFWRLTPPRKGRRARFSLARRPSSACRSPRRSARARALRVHWALGRRYVLGQQTARGPQTRGVRSPRRGRCRVLGQQPPGSARRRHAVAHDAGRRGRACTV